MNFEEILPYLKDGAKVRWVFWKSDQYIHLYKGDLEDQDGHKYEHITNKAIFSDGWSLYKKHVYLVYENSCLTKVFLDKTACDKYIENSNGVVKYEALEIDG